MWGYVVRGDMVGSFDVNKDKFWCYFCVGNNVVLIIWGI